MKNFVLAAALVLSSLMGSARADEPAVPAQPVATPHLIGGNTGVLVGGVGDQPYVFGAIALNGGVILGVGVGVAFDGTLATDKVSALGILYGSYMFKNVANFAVGPELFIITPFAPTPASTLTFRPGVALWYAPFSAPVLLGTAIDVDLTYVKASSAMKVALVTPGVRIAYAF